MIARGLMLGPDQPVILHLLDIEPALESLNGVKMELIDAAFPLLRGVVATKDSVEACTGVDIAIMVGGFPRKEGMERKDVMSKNVSIYKDQASALEKHASPNCKVLMVANPANTNALILKEFAPSFPEKNITCLTRLDHNRALGQISEKTDVQVWDVKNGIIWGNHSSTQYPDVSHATVTTSSGEVPVKELVKNEQWIKPEFIKTVQQRGAATIQARKLSSALSAASSACDHIRDWVLGTPKDDQLLHYIVKHNLLKPIVDAFVDNGDRYNLLNSAVLELFEYIRKENLKTLIMYLIDSFWNQLVKFDYLTSIQALKLKYEQCQESLETKRNVSVVDPRKRIDERALEKEEEDYFNEDSDEEDSASAQSSHTQKQATQTVVPNGVSISYPAVRSKSGGLVDYDDDEDDEDYNPPPRRKPEISGDGRTMEFSQKAKQKHRSEEEFELRKKQRLHRVLNNDNVSLAAACSTCTNTVSHSEITNTMSNSIPHSPDEVNESSNDGKNSEKKPSLSRSCSDCSAKTADSRQPNEDDCPVVSSSVNNSSLEVAVNGANVPGSEPYSVR